MEEPRFVTKSLKLKDIEILNCAAYQADGYVSRVLCHQYPNAPCRDVDQRFRPTMRTRISDVPLAQEAIDY